MAYEATLISTLRGEVSGEEGGVETSSPSSPSKALLHVAGPRHAPHSTFSLLLLLSRSLSYPFVPISYPYLSLPSIFPLSRENCRLPRLAFLFFVLYFFSSSFLLSFGEIRFGHVYRENRLIQLIRDGRGLA